MSDPLRFTAHSGILRHAINGLGPRALAEIAAALEEWPNPAELRWFSYAMKTLADRMETGQ